MLPIKTRPNSPLPVPVTARAQDGSVLTLGDLPPSGTVRWTAKKKSDVIDGIHAGLISTAEALKRYGLSSEELLSWEELHKHGPQALRATHVQDYRGSGMVG